MPDGPITAVRPGEDLDYGALRDSIGFLIRIAQLKIFEQFFQHAGNEGLKPGEFCVLWLIGRNPGVRQGVLAQKLMIKPAHMTKVIRGLEDRGYVRRTIPDGDRRAVELTLESAGDAFIARNRSAFFAVPDGASARLTKDEHDTLCGLLQKLAGLDEGRTP